MTTEAKPARTRKTPFIEDPATVTWDALNSKFITKDKANRMAQQVNAVAAHYKTKNDDMDRSIAAIKTAVGAKESMTTLQFSILDGRLQRQSENLEREVARVEDNIASMDKIQEENLEASQKYLNEEIERLAKLVKKTALAGTAVANGKFDLALESLVGRLDTADRQIKINSQKLDGLSSSTQSQNIVQTTRLDQIGARVDNVEKNVDYLDTTVRRIKQTADAMKISTEDQKRVASNNAVLDKAIKEVRSDLDKEVRGLRATQGGLVLGVVLMTLTGLATLSYSVISGIFKRKKEAKGKKKMEDELDDMAAALHNRIHARDINLPYELDARARY
jgi:hypothetical protein